MVLYFDYSQTGKLALYINAYNMTTAVLFVAMFTLKIEV